MRKLISFILILLFSAAAFAQKKAGTTKEKAKSQPTSLDPNFYESNYAERKTTKRSKSKGVTYNSEREFYERLDDLEKTRRKNERMMDKPQYSDPMYFGHKRPPKKRSPDKMKFCKVCGIKH